jgi:hypothetical protein
MMVKWPVLSAFSWLPTLTKEQLDIAQLFAVDRGPG